MSRENGMKVFIFALWALILPVLAYLTIGDARAEDPTAAARAIGQAGQSAARAIARDPASAAGVPGYVGTNLPERGLGAGDLRDAADQVLTDPADPGGRAGRSVIEGAAGRPDAPSERTIRSCGAGTGSKATRILPSGARTGSRPDR